jgi:hypothetical protein
MQILETETHVQLIQLHMTRLQIFFRQRMKKHRHDVLIEIFVDRLNIVYSKREDVVAEEQRKRSLRERSDERKQCTSSYLQTRKRTSFSRTELSSSFF